MIITEMRCHLVSITLTAPDAQARETLAGSLDQVLREMTRMAAAPRIVIR